ncbi:MAG: trypsin-like serine protease [Phycisphaeraceae bacterium]
MPGRWCRLAVVALVTGGALAGGPTTSAPAASMYSTHSGDFTREYYHSQLANHISRYEPVGQVRGWVEGATDGSLLPVGWGSGTIIQTGDANADGYWILTAAHVVEGIGPDLDDGPHQYTFRRGAGGDPIGTWNDELTAEAWFVHPGWKGSAVAVADASGASWSHDLALIRLEVPDFGASPARLHQGGPLSRGTELGIVGYGTLGNGHLGQVVADQRKRAGKNSLLEYRNEFLFEYRFDQHPSDPSYFGPGFNNNTGGYLPIDGLPEQPVGLEWSSTQGDSGGPVFDGNDLAGITSYGRNAWVGLLGGFHGIAGQVAVAPHFDWIMQVMLAYEEGGIGPELDHLAVIGTPGSPILYDAAGNVIDPANPGSAVSWLDVPYDHNQAIDHEDFFYGGQAFPQMAHAYSDVFQWMTGYDPEEQTFAEFLADGGTAYGDLIDSGNVLLPGDMNLDGVTDAIDVAAFVLALTDPEAYIAQTGIDPIFMGDINYDGVFDAVDVAGFVELLVGGGASSVPEPGSLALLGLAAAGMLTRRRR